MMNWIKLGVASLLTVLLTPAAFAQEPVQLPANVIELRQLADQAHASGDKELFRSVIRRLHELRPNNGEYMYDLVLAHAMLGELKEAFDMMLSMQRQGMAYDFNQSPNSLALRDKNIYSYLNDLLIKAGESFGEASVIARLEGEIGLTEGLAWDPTRSAFLVATVSDGRLLAVGEDGSVAELLRADSENGLWGIHDVVVDEARNRLWLASSAVPAFSGFDTIDRGRSAAFEFELDTLKLVKRYPVPVDGLPHVLGQATLAPSGDLFFADRALPIVYILKSGNDRLQPLFASPELVSLRGIAVADDASKLYVADYEMGILVIDMKSGEAGMLGRPDTLNLGGIDGLEYLDGSLVIVQGGFQPQRIMRLELAEGGGGVANLAPVAVALDILDYPSFSTLVGEDLVFLANGAGRSEKDGAEPLRIARAGLTGVANLVPPDMQKFLDERERTLLEQARTRAQSEAAESGAESQAESDSGAESADSPEKEGDQG